MPHQRRKRNVFEYITHHTADNEHCSFGFQNVDFQKLPFVPERTFLSVCVYVCVVTFYAVIVRIDQTNRTNKTLHVALLCICLLLRCCVC